MISIDPNQKEIAVSKTSNPFILVCWLSFEGRGKTAQRARVLSPLWARGLVIELVLLVPDTLPRGLVRFIRNEEPPEKQKEATAEEKTSF